MAVITPSVIPGARDWLSSLALLDELSDSVCVVDRDWVCTHANRRAVRDLGQGRNLIGKNLWAMVPHFARPGIAAALRTAMSESKTTRSEDIDPFSARPISANAYPMPNGLIIFLRTLARSKIRKNPSLEVDRGFQDMFRALGQAALLFDATGSVVDANPAAESIFGDSVLHMLSANAEAFGWQTVDAAGAPFAPGRRPVELALSTGNAQSVVVGVHNPARGIQHWLSVDVVPQFKESSISPTHAYALVRDVTQQTPNEKSPDEDRLYLKLARRVGALGSATMDIPSGAWELCDDTYRMFGVRKGEFFPAFDALLSIVHAGDRELFCDCFKAAESGIVPYPLEIRIIRPNGSQRVLYQEIDLIKSASGILSKIILTFCDVTEWRAAERQKEIFRQQLLHAQRLESIGILAGGIAHDLNNAFVPILSLSEAMLNSPGVSSKQRPFLDLVYKSAIRARDLVRQILIFSRGESPEYCVVELIPLIQEVMRLIRATVPTSIKVEQTFSGTPCIFGNPSQLYQVVLNLVTNAVQAIGEDSGTVAVDIGLSKDRGNERSGADSKGWVRLSISDTGCGIDEKTLTRIFEPFFTTKKSGVGTGLGLPVVQDIVAAHGGRIQVSSKLGQCTRFDIFLPVLDSKQIQLHKKEPVL
jgi:signal transduction histidine kinase